ncbi:hypothetical protein Ciccas_007273 [Cichlidogyrus casuarinus]|uniref:EF-hand domain-containing protein n=1 Tax=Cichlidogyrus casuarinus TaxID=1844966 RepID=A0ABD2Q4P2_9PLAT
MNQDYQLFIDADKDYNGRLTFVELSLHATKINHPNLANDWFAKYDREDKGYITIQDLKNVLRDKPDQNYM